MRTIALDLLLSFLAGLSLTAAAQSAPSPASPTAACGDENTAFDVRRGELGDHATPEPGKAMVYIIEVSNLNDKHKVGRPLIRQGLDGAWIGATQGFTYVSAAVDPGTHHLCSHWQSSFKRLSDQVSLNNFDAVAGKTYYFRVQIGYEAGVNGGAPAMIDLQPVSDDEGRLLVSEAAQSLSSPKK